MQAGYYKYCSAHFKEEFKEIFSFAHLVNFYINNLYRKTYIFNGVTITLIK